MDVYLLEEQSCQISSRSDLKWRSLRAFMKRGPNKNKNKMSSDKEKFLINLVHIVFNIITWYRTLDFFATTLYLNAAL